MIASSRRVITALTTGIIEMNRVMEELESHENGAIASFCGVIRNHNDGALVDRLEYHAYEPMAGKILDSIARTGLDQFELTGVAIIHRIGAVELGGLGLLVVTTSEHRRASLDGCSWIVEEIKRDLPVWKLEHRIGITGEKIQTWTS